MPNPRKIGFIGLSVALHVAVIGTLVIAQSRNTSLSALWQGGGAGSITQRGNGGVVLIDLTTADFPTHPQSAPAVTPTTTAQKNSQKKNLPQTKPTKTQSAPTSASSGAGNGTGLNAGNGVGQGLDDNGPQTPNLLAKIRQKILAAKTYPQSARDAGEAGKVKVSFLIGPDGSLTSSAVIASSGHARLDNAALATLKRATPLPFYPQPIVLTLEYQLETEEGLTW